MTATVAAKIGGGGLHYHGHFLLRDLLIYIKERQFWLRCMVDQDLPISLLHIQGHLVDIFLNV